MVREPKGRKHGTIVGMECVVILAPVITNTTAQPILRLNTIQILAASRIQTKGLQMTGIQSENIDRPIRLEKEGLRRKARCFSDRESR